MDAQQTAALLTVVSTFDRRTLAEGDVHAWQTVLGDLRFEECRDAVVKHYATATEWVMPAHVRRLCLAARQDVAMRALPASGDDLVPQPDWFRTTVAHWKARTREGNEGKWRPGKGPMPKDRDERGTYGETVMHPKDGRPGW